MSQNPESQRIELPGQEGRQLARPIGASKPGGPVAQLSDDDQAKLARMKDDPIRRPRS